MLRRIIASKSYPDNNITLIYTIIGIYRNSGSLCFCVQQMEDHVNTNTIYRYWLVNSKVYCLHSFNQSCSDNAHVCSNLQWNALDWWYWIAWLANVWELTVKSTKLCYWISRPAKRPGVQSSNTGWAHFTGNSSPVVQSSNNVCVSLSIRTQPGVLASNTCIFCTHEIITHLLAWNWNGTCPLSWQILAKHLQSH